MQTHASNADLTITSQRPHTHTRPTKALRPALTRPLPPSPKSTYDHRHQCHFFSFTILTLEILLLTM